MKDENLKDFKIGIIGTGMVGGALRGYLKKSKSDLLFYDKGRNEGSIQDVNKSDIIFICVPTPFNKKTGFDLSYVADACNNISGNKIVIIKSTILPGTTDLLQQKYPQHKFLFNPEFLREITAEQDMNYPERQIIGYTKESYNVASDILQILPKAPFEKIMPASEAEMVKYFGNTWLSVKVIFANQIYDLCQKLGFDYDRVMEAAAADKRIEKSHLEIFHGGYRGYGGKCLPKDIKAFIQFADDQGIDLKLHKVVEEINNKLMHKQRIDDPENFSKR